MKVLICGPRDWDKPVPVDVIVGGFGSVYGTENLTVVHGAARGADSMASSAAHRHGIDSEAFPADWAAHGRAAGPRRNQAMLDIAQPDVVCGVARLVLADLALTRGTGDMLRRSVAADVPTYLFAKLTR